jgi:hypothetical protein
VVNNLRTGIFTKKTERTIEKMKKLPCLAPRNYGKFVNLQYLNAHQITMFNLRETKYYDHFPEDGKVAIKYAMNIL